MKQCDECGSYYSEVSSSCPYCGVENTEYDIDNWVYNNLDDNEEYDNEEYDNEEYDNEEEF